MCNQASQHKQTIDSAWRTRQLHGRLRRELCVCCLMWREKPFHSLLLSFLTAVMCNASCYSQKKAYFSPYLQSDLTAGLESFQIKKSTIPTHHQPNSPTIVSTLYITTIHKTIQNNPMKLLKCTIHLKNRYRSAHSRYMEDWGGGGCCDDHYTVNSHSCPSPPHPQRSLMVFTMRQPRQTRRSGGGHNRWTRSERRTAAGAHAVSTIQK